MKKYLLCAIAGLAATFALSGVSAHAQDVADSASTQAVNVVPAEPAAPAAIPAPAPRPQFLSDNGKFVFFAGYSFLDTNITEGNDGEGSCNDICYGRTEGNGFDMSGTYMLNPNFGLTADFSGNYGGVKVADPAGSSSYDRLSQNSYYFLFGPTVSKSIGKVTLSAHALAGVARMWAGDQYTSSGVTTEEGRVPWATGFAVGLGGSADWMFSSKVGWRVAQFDWLWSDGAQGYDGNLYPEHNAVSAVRFSTGIVLNLGHAR